MIFATNGSAATASPLDMIRATVERARAVLEDPAHQGKDYRQQRLEKLKEVVLPQFDSQEIAKRTLGIHWRDRTDEERKEFIRLFTDLVEKTYSDNLDRYSRNVQFFYDQERVEENFAEVDTRILDPSQSKIFSLSYRLHKVDGKWLIYDVVIENVSLVRNYRNQFNRILAKSSYDDLLKSIQKKLDQLDTTPPSEHQPSPSL
jgi:phospholipid transport system substrate-binding protein